MHRLARFHVSFFFNDTATTEIYTLSLHDALPISRRARRDLLDAAADAYDAERPVADRRDHVHGRDRKSTRLNSSHGYISYAVFCLQLRRGDSASPALLLADNESSCLLRTVIRLCC